MIRTTFLVPVKDNEEHPFGPEDWEELEERLIQRFGGFTDGGMFRGAWAHNQQVYRDHTRLYIVNLGSWTMMPKWLDTVWWVRKHFRQIELCVEVAGIAENVGA